MAGLSLRLVRKLPGASDITRNDRNVIPIISGIMMSRRFIRNLAIACAARDYFGPELDPFGLVVPPYGGLEILQRVLPRLVTHLPHRLDDRQLLVQDFLDAPVVRRALERIHHHRALFEQVVDLGLPRRSRLGLLRIPQVQAPEERRKSAPLLGSIPPVKPISTTSQS